MKTILLIRHGRTDANEKAIYCGISDVSLSENGIKSLRDKKNFYKNLVGVNAKYFTSGLKRTEETLNILFESNGKTPEFTVVKGFREINFGKFELYSYNDLKEDKEYITWISGDFGKNVPPLGESGEQMEKRVKETFDKFLKSDFMKKENAQAVIVCHGGTIYYLMHYLFPNEDKTIYEWQPTGGDGYLLKFDDGIWSYEKVGLWENKENLT